MPLSKASVNRNLSHTRKIEACGYLREDGLWDIEAEMRDIKGFEIPNQDREGGIIKLGDALHNMWLRITIDENLLIHASEAVTDASPYAMCGDIVGVYDKLVGLRIAPGWNREIKRLFGGVQGCTHITELLGVIATVSFQTVYSDKVRARRLSGVGEDSGGPGHLNTCHALATDSEVVKRDYPDAYVKKE